MFDSEKSTGTQYTMVALLVVAFVVSPAVLMLSRPIGYPSISLAFLCSAVCVAWAWLNWKNHSRLAMAPIAR